MDRAFTISAAAILLFAKAPVAGRCKSRLIPSLGAEGAAALQAQLIQWQLERLHALPDTTIELWCAPDTTHPWLQQMGQQYSVALFAQQGAGLAERQYHAITEGLRRHRTVVLVGVDVVGLPVTQIVDAIGCLTGGVELVITPCDDGGYGLIGMNQADIRPFVDIPWGSDQVFAVTQQRLHQMGCNWQAQEPVWDLDRPADLLRLRQQAQQLGWPPGPGLPSPLGIDVAAHELM